MAREYDSLFQRIKSKVVTLDWQNENGCWIFTGKLDKYGYGRVNVRIAGRHLTLRVHRVIWESINGPEPVTRQVNTSRSHQRNPREQKRNKKGQYERRTNTVTDR